MVLSKCSKQDASFSTPKIYSSVVTIPYWILGVAFRQIFSQYPVKFITYKTRRNSRSKNGNWCKTWFRSIRKKHNQHERIYQRLQILTSIFFFFFFYHIASSLESGFQQYTVKFTLCFVTLKNTLKILLSLRVDCFRLRRMTSCNFVLTARSSYYFLWNNCTLFRSPPMFATGQCHQIRWCEFYWQWHCSPLN